MRTLGLALSALLALGVALPPARAGEILSRGPFTYEFDEGYLPVAQSFISALGFVADDVERFLSVDGPNLTVRIYSEANFAPRFPPFGVWASALEGNLSVGLPPLPSALSLGWTPERLRSVAAHELTHLLLPTSFPNATVGLPAWLEEGLANYLGSRYDSGIDPTSRGLMKYLVDTSGVRTIDEMTGRVPYVTTQGYSLIVYLVNAWGAGPFEVFLQALREIPGCCELSLSHVNQALLQAHGQDSVRMTSGWQTWLREEYTRDYRYVEVPFPRLPLPDSGIRVPGSWVGDRIAFSQETAVGVRSCVSQATGSDLRCAPGPATIVADPRLSPDGDRVLLTTNAAGHYDLALWNLTDDTIALLTNDTFVDVAGSWSPDAREVLFSSTRSGNFDIWRMSLGDGIVTALTGDPSDEFAPAFSPDGSRIAFASNRTGRYTVVVSNRTGQGARALWEAGPYLGFPSWGPDGTKLAASLAGPGYSGIVELGVTYDGRAVVVNLTTGPDETGAGFWAGFPVYKPDGREIAFTSLADIRTVGAALIAPRGSDSILPTAAALAAVLTVGAVILIRRARRRKRGQP